jgi:hypothetical protein
MVCYEDFRPFTGKTMRCRVHNAHDLGVGARVLRGPSIREIAAIAILTSLAVALAWFLVAADMRSDLSALRPLGKTTDVRTVLISWPELRDSLGSPDTRVRMLGYMMEAGLCKPKGEEITTFILTPRAGQMLRAASRNPADGVEVRLRRSAHFSNRELVWVCGRIEHAARPSGGTSATSYVMMDSEVSPAEQREITRWFTP